MMLLGEVTDVSHPKWGKHDELATAVIQLLCRFYDLVDSESVFFSVVAKREVSELGDLMGSLVSQLATWCYDREIKLWKCHRSSTSPCTYVLTR